ISAAALWIVPGNFGCGVSVLAAMATLAPSRAARASPMPRDAPVMKIVFPFSDISWPRNSRRRGVWFCLINRVAPIAILVVALAWRRWVRAFTGECLFLAQPGY